MLPDRAYLAALTCFPKFGARRLQKILNAFSSAEEAFRAPQESLLRAGIEEEHALAFTMTRAEISPEKIWEIIEQEKITVLTAKDTGFPLLLKEIYDPPAVLFVKGKMDEPDPFPFAVVGTRMISAYGRQVTPHLIAPLARAGLAIVSGLALGVDALAHETAITENGRTIAVLGSGLDAESVYPSANRYLSQKIIESGGAVISEFPPGTPPLKQHFPFRNRIISGMSVGTLVIEAADDSGSLITARSALEQNREVFAVPGNIFGPGAIGPNNLLKMGAKVVTCADDILESLHLERAQDFLEAQEVHPDTPVEAALLQILSREPIHIDRLAKNARLDIGQTMSTLTLMEMKGKVKNLGGMQYVKSR